MTEPRTKAGRAYLASLDPMGEYPDGTYDKERRAILAIEAEAVAPSVLVRSTSSDKAAALRERPR